MNTQQLLEQDQIWRTRDGMPIPLLDMEPSHRANTLAFLRRRAEYLAKAYAYCDAVSHFFDDECGAFELWLTARGRTLSDTAEAWLERRPLIVALARLVAADQRGPVVDGEVVVHELERR